MIAGLVACGGSIAGVDGASSSGGSSSGGTSSGGSSSGGSSGGSSSGSSSGGSSGTIPYDVDLCEGGTSYEALVGVTPAPQGSFIDYMELRDEYATGGTAQPPVVVAKTGTPCSTAADRPACQEALANARSAGWPVESIGMEMPRTRYLVATLGEGLTFATSLDDLKAFITPIDNAKDAALLVTATGKYRVKCGTPNARRTATGWEIRTETGHTCGKGTHLDEVVIEVSKTGDQYTKSTTLLEEGNPNCAIGRRPAGLCERARETCDAEGALARFFGEAAYLEAASVFAFERLEEELVRLGAPVDLIETARVSRDDEVRHARMTASLAKRFGANVSEPAVAEAKERTPFEIALENAVEGCVRETYGALVAHWQAANAGDRAIACIMHAIAEDETRHAALAWDVAAWLEPRLSPFERRAVNEARENAKRELYEELAREVDADLVMTAGMPRAADALALFEALDASHLRAAA